MSLSVTYQRNPFKTVDGHKFLIDYMLLSYLLWCEEAIIISDKNDSSNLNLESA